ncbi:uncharacterized protein LOC127709521 [Mytilus californianus]|uniref:uncharacterized protein LOC127709521 n=1 Tax=Mytilus californianus TaxID=6549 RepID=UPI0022469284|nr:uncharacterized protein LOC127709521 [Mytilus californianus]
MSKSIMVAVCLECENNLTNLEYHWSLSWYDTSIQQYVTEKDFESMTDTGTNRKTLVILENQVKKNTKYLLVVKVNRIGEKEENGGRLIFFTNMPPYGGSCKASNSSATGRAAEILNTPEDMIPTGTASSTLFAILCKDWKDEGLETDQDEQRDAEQENPLLYEYFLYLNHTDYRGKRVTEKIPIYRGGESTASELRLPVGDQQDDYVIQVVVTVFDRFGDYSKMYLKVTCLPNDEYTPTNEGDTNKTSKMLKNFDDNYDMTDAGGNDIAVFRLMKSTAGFYNNLTFENSTTKADTSSLEKLVSYDDELQGEVQNTLQQRSLDLITKVSDKVPENSSLIILPADTILIAKTIQSCISNIDVMTENSSAEVSTVAYNLIQNIQKVSNKIPLPMTERENIQEATADVLGILSENVEFLSTASQENLNKTLTKELVEEELIEYYRYHPEGIEGFPTITDVLINLMHEKKRKIRERQTNMANSTSVTVDKLIGTLDSAINITSSTIAFGEGEKVVQQNNLNVSIEKDSTEMFLNRSEIKRDGFSLDLQNDTLENITATELELQVSVFKKSPLLHAGGHSQIRERIIGISVRDGKRENVDIPLTMRIQNEGIAFATEHSASVGDNMEFVSPLQDKNDAVLIYLKPEGFDDTNIDDYNFTVLIKSKISPSLNDYDFSEKISTRSWTVFGFKVFVPSMTLEEGNIVIAINAIEGTTEENTIITNRKRRSIDDVEISTNETLLTNMSIAIVTTGCRSFNPQSQSWNPNGCSVLPFSSLNETVCRCPPAAGKFFATSFLTPNLIDFTNVFAQFDASNAAVYGTMIGLFLIYVGLFIYFRRKDKADVFKWVPYIMCDNKGCDEYFYMVTIHTGLRPVSGTKSNVCFIVAGENQDTGVRMLSDGNLKARFNAMKCYCFII